MRDMILVAMLGLVVAGYLILLGIK